jgi:hypothetical protein
MESFSRQTIIAPQNREAQASNQEVEISQYNLISPCNCEKVRWEQFLICSYVKRWLTLIEIKTDTRIDYKHCLEVYERVQLKPSLTDEER